MDNTYIKSAVVVVCSVFLQVAIKLGSKVCLHRGLPLSTFSLIQFFVSSILVSLGQWGNMIITNKEN